MEKLQSVYRITIYADGSLESRIVERLLECGARGYTAMDGRGSGQRQIVENMWGRAEVSRIEVLTREETGQKIVNAINRDFLPKFPVTLCVDEVKVVRADHF